MGALVEVGVDYLVVGAGAMGMAFADALIDNADVTVAIVDRRHAPGGHWLDAYPFVRLHQASAFYGVASTLLGGGALQTQGPEAGLQERATGPEICVYYAQVLERLLRTGRVQFFPATEHLGEGRFRSLVSGTEYHAPRARLVDATYLSGTIPSTAPPPFAVEGGARVVPVNDLAHLEAPPRRFVVVGSGKTATDACVWLLQRGVAPDAITWVRPRDPWMLNRAVIQPDPAIFLGMAADTMRAARDATSADDVFFRMEEQGIMVRIDPRVTPRMAKTPTIASWEVDHLRTIDAVVRRGHLRAVTPGWLRFDDGDVAIDTDTVVVHCAAEGLPHRPLVPIWQPDAIRPRPVRVGFPCFGAAMTGYVEATRSGDEAKNDVCRPSPYSDTTTDWLTMQIIGGDASIAMSRHPDVKRWANETSLNPARVPDELRDDPAVLESSRRLRENIGHGRARIAELAAQVR